MKTNRTTTTVNGFAKRTATIVVIAGCLLMPQTATLGKSSPEAGAVNLDASAVPDAAVCENFKGTLLWGQCTRAIVHGCHESQDQRCEQYAASWRDETGLEPPWLAWGGSGSCAVFVTSQAYGGNLGGLAGADANCQSRADASDLVPPGTYKAWLSASTGWPADGVRFTQSSVPYTRLDGTRIANYWPDLIDGRLSAPLNVNEAGITVGETFVWTGTLPNGTWYERELVADGVVLEPHCQDWSTSEDIGGIGNVNFMQNGWTTVGFSACSASRPLYCFQQ